MSDVKFVLLHGAGLGGWIWESVIPELPGEVFAVDLHGQDDLVSGSVTLERCVAHVLARIEDWDRVIVVGHSVSGGLALRIASELGDRAVGLVMVAAVVPESGKSYVDMLPWGQRWLLKVLYTVAPKGLRPPAKVVATALCNDLDEAVTSSVTERMNTPWPRLFLDPVKWSLRDDLSRHYLVLSDDSSDLSPAMQNQFAAALGATVTELRSGHLPMLGHPAAVAKVLRSMP